MILVSNAIKENGIVTRLFKHLSFNGSVLFLLLACPLVFGYIKGRFTGARPFRSGIQTVLIGGLAAAAAFGLARLLST